MTGGEFRAALDALSLTQRDFAARFALDPTVVSRWGNRYKVPVWVPGALTLLSGVTYVTITDTSLPRRRTVNKHPR